MQDEGVSPPARPRVGVPGLILAALVGVCALGGWGAASMAEPRSVSPSDRSNTVVAPDRDRLDPVVLPAAELRYAIELDRQDLYTDAAAAYDRAARDADLVDDVPVQSEALRRHATMLSRQDAVGGFEAARGLLHEAISLDEAYALSASLTLDLQSLIFVHARRGEVEDIEAIGQLQARLDRVGVDGDTFAARLQRAQVQRSVMGDALGALLQLEAMPTGELSPAELAYLRFVIGAYHLDLGEPVKAGVHFTQAARAFDALGAARVFQREATYWSLLARRGEVEARFRQAGASPRGGAALSAEVRDLKARALSQLQSEVVRQDYAWHADLLAAEIDARAGADVTAQLQTLLPDAPNAEDRFLAASLLAERLASSGRRGDGVQLAAQTLSEDFAKPFCTIPALRARWAQLNQSYDKRELSSYDAIVVCD